MNALRFSPSRSPFSASLHKRVADYFTTNQITRKGDWRSALKVALLLGLYVVPFVLIVTIPLSKTTQLLLCIAMGFGMAGTGMSIMHDAAHGALSSSPWVNRLFSRTIYLLGSGHLNWAIQHNQLHHNFTNVYGVDEDMGGRSVLRFSSEAPAKKIHRFQHRYAYVLYSLLTLSKLVKDFAQLARYNQNGMSRAQNKAPQREMATLIFFKVAYFATIFGLPLLLTTDTWWEVLVGFTVMHCVGGFVMALIFQLAHLVDAVDKPLANAEGVLAQEWAVHQLQTTANFAQKNRWLSWYVGGLNFQIEHHLFPGVNHVHYPKLAPIVEATAKEFGLPYHNHQTLGDAISSHTRFLKSLGT